MTIRPALMSAMISLIGASALMRGFLPARCASLHALDVAGDEVDLEVDRAGGEALSVVTWTVWGMRPIEKSQPFTR